MIACTGDLYQVKKMFEDILSSDNTRLATQKYYVKLENEILEYEKQLEEEHEKWMNEKLLNFGYTF